MPILTDKNATFNVGWGHLFWTTWEQHRSHTDRDQDLVSVLVSHSISFFLRVHVPKNQHHKKVRISGKKCVWGGYLEDHPVCEVHAPPVATSQKQVETIHPLKKTLKVLFKNTYCNFLHPYFMTHMSGEISGSTLVWCIMIYQLDSMDLFLRSPFAQQKTATGRLFQVHLKWKGKPRATMLLSCDHNPALGSPDCCFPGKKSEKVFENLQWFWINRWNIASQNLILSNHPDLPNTMVIFASRVGFFASLFGTLLHLIKCTLTENNIFPTDIFIPAKKSSQVLTCFG